MLIFATDNLLLTQNFNNNMMEKEIIETYCFNPADFDESGRRYGDGVSFRDVVKEYERDFHKCHSTEYALNLYANSCTMALLAKSNDAAPFLIYGMDLTQGRSFDAIQDSMLFKILTSITKWNNIVIRYMYMVSILLL